MGNKFEIDLSKFNCSCLKNEDGYFLNLLDDFKNNDIINMLTNSQKFSTSSELQEDIPGSLFYPNDNMVKIKAKKTPKVNTFPHSESENEFIEINTNKNSNLNSISNINNNNEEEQKERDIKDFDKKTDYFQLANQINKAIIELKMNIYSDDEENQLKSLSTPTPDSENINGDVNFPFQNFIKIAGKLVDKKCFNEIIGAIKRISDIHSEVILRNHKIYLGIANKFRKEKNDKYLINYEDEEKIVDLPNFEDIEEKYRLKLGEKFNNPKFKFNKFTLKGSFPNEILIWNLISQNTNKIVDILTENYYCCLVLLYYSKVEEENETIMYLVNKPTII